jgi:hypothetical protein
MDSLIQYNNAVNAIKTAILQGQYEAAKGVNRIQLALYFAIGKYLSQHTRKDTTFPHNFQGFRIHQRTTSQGTTRSSRILGNSNEGYETFL